jgi:NADH-quinone oxidoreductase subunit E
MSEKRDRQPLEREEIETVKEILKGAPKGRDNLITILLDVQKRLGYLPSRAMKEVARFLGIAECDVWSVATFYNEFRFVPRGRHHVRVCLGTACHIKGGKVIMQSWERKLDIKEGGVTADREFSLGSVGCVGCCSMAPVAVVNEEVHGSMSPIKVDGILLRIDLDRKGAAKEK